jgi:TonB family protein
MQRTILAVGLWLFIVTAAATVSSQGVAPNPSVNGSFGPTIQFDTRGVEFGPWIRQFVPQIRRHWLIPCVAAKESGHTVITFNIQKDGTIVDVNVRTPSRVPAFNESAQIAILASSPTVPLPSGYPALVAFFTLTFYYNELPSGSSQPTDTTTGQRPAQDFACSLVGAMNLRWSDDLGSRHLSTVSGGHTRHRAETFRCTSTMRIWCSMFNRRASI